MKIGFRFLIGSLTVLAALLTATGLGAVTIYEIQYTTNAGPGTYPSPYANQAVTTQGIVTASGYGGGSGYFISMPEGGAWKGILVYDSAHSPEPGTLLTLTGQVYEYYGLTELRSIAYYQVESTGNALPPAEEVSTLEANAEAYEGVLFRVADAVCTQTLNGSGAWKVNDGSGELVIDDYLFDQSGLSGLIVLGASFSSVTGIGHYSYSTRSLNPRFEADVAADSIPEVITETPDTLSVIQRPLLNIPAIVVPGETFNIECVADPATTGWTAWLQKGNLTYGLPLANTDYETSPPRWVLTAQVPAVNVNELYDLHVAAAGLSDRTRHSVQVLPTRKTNYYFAHVTDVHMPTHAFSSDAGYDPADSSETVDFREVINDLNIIRPEFVLLTGDLVNEGELEDYTGARQYTKAKRLLGELEVPVYLVSGNHDIGGWDSTPPPAGTSRRNWWKNFGWSWLDNPSPAWPYHTQDYSFNYGNVHYVGLEAYNNSGGYDDYLPGIYGTDSFTAAQLQWLQADLASTQAETKVFFYHYDYQDQISLSALGLDLGLWGHTHYNSGSLTTQPYDLQTNNVCDGERSYRIIKVNGTQLQPLAAVSAGVDGGQITLAFEPGNTGAADSVTAYLVNNHTASYEHALIKFAMPAGNHSYTVINGTLEQIDSNGGFNVCYVRTTLPAGSSRTVTVYSATEAVPQATAWLSISTYGSCALLEWDEVSEDTNGNPVAVSFYTVEASEDPYSGFEAIGTTTLTQYTDPDESYACRFYRVKAQLGNP